MTDDLTLHVYEGPVASVVTVTPPALSAFASDLGMPPGFWPARLRIPGFPEFYRHEDHIDSDGEGWFDYRSKYGPSGPITFRVFND